MGGEEGTRNKERGAAGPFATLEGRLFHGDDPDRLFGSFGCFRAVMCSVESEADPLMFSTAAMRHRSRSVLMTGVTTHEKSVAGAGESAKGWVARGRAGASAATALLRRFPAWLSRRMESWPGRHPPGISAERSGAAASRSGAWVVGLGETPIARRRDLR